MIPLSRRTFLAGAGAFLAAPLPAARAGGAEEGWLATAAADEGFAAFGISPAFAAEVCVPSPVRLHGIEASPTGPLAVAVGRRPGRIALVFDWTRKAQVGAFTPGDGRVFSGHARFSPDGRFLFTNEIERPVAVAGRPTMGRGVLTRRDVAGGFAVRDEWVTGGDGPHDLMGVSQTLVIANGGIEPNTPEARDAEVTGSSITVLDPVTGRMRGEGRLDADFASLSLRHLARSPDRGAVVAAQDLLNDGVARPLLFHIGIDGTLAPFEAPDPVWRELRGYVGSVAYDLSGRFVACTSPRGGRVSVWRADGRHLGALPMVDGCGLAAGREPGRFVATSGYGEVVLIAASDDGVGVIARRAAGPRFDNHMCPVA